MKQLRKLIRKLKKIIRVHILVVAKKHPVEFVTKNSKPFVKLKGTKNLSTKTKQLKKEKNSLLMMSKEKSKGRLSLKWSLILFRPLPFLVHEKFVPQEFWVPRNFGPKKFDPREIWALRSLGPE